MTRSSAPKAPDHLSEAHNLACGDSWWKGEACYHGTPSPESLSRFHEEAAMRAIELLFRAAPNAKPEERSIEGQR